VGFQAQISYTYSKAIAYNDEADSGLFFNAPSALARNRALTNYDRTHNLQAGWLAELPFGAGKRWATGGLGRRLFAGWQERGLGRRDNPR
jgi:hypothetical protein